MTPEEFRKHGHELIDWIADFRQRVYGGRVSGAVASASMGSCALSCRRRPCKPLSLSKQIVRDLDRHIVPALSHFQHPSFFGYFPRTACSPRCSAIT